MTASIPTMPCPECDAQGYRWQLGARHYVPRSCVACDGTGRVERPPLSPEEVAALPDGARVVALVTVPHHLETGRMCAGVWDADAEWVFGRFGDGPPWTGQYGIDECRVWLAEDADD